MNASKYTAVLATTEFYTIEQSSAASDVYKRQDMVRVVTIT